MTVHKCFGLGSLIQFSFFSSYHEMIFLKNEVGWTQRFNNYGSADFAMGLIFSPTEKTRLRVKCIT